jgi:hypothetical protein
MRSWPLLLAAIFAAGLRSPAVLQEKGCEDRIFIAARGELKLPEKLGRGYNGIWGSLGQRELHQMSVDSEGNFYGADRAKLIVLPAPPK